MNRTVLKGTEFLARETNANDIFIPEEFNEEQIMIQETCKDFLNAEIFPDLENLDKMEAGLMKAKLQKAGEYGLLGISIPEEYEGFGQSFVTSMLASDILGAGHSFAVAFSAHTGIGSLPIVYYGNKEQKQRYLPSLGNGEKLAAYCLTEPNAGSDANSGKTKAILSEDEKHYILNGQKMWITNGGFADILIVFAKIDNDRILSAFIVEKDYPGVSINPEEKKMGIKGSSTVQIFFNDCLVPVENLLGKRGEGFRIALNILHIGRIKLGGNVIGGAKRAINHAINYSNERKQFGQLISSFGAIKFKIAEQAIRIFALESAVYRTSQYIDDKISQGIEQGLSKEESTIEALGEYALEAAILKIFGSESLDYIVDETVQIYGGMGYSSEAEADRCFRDSRINRIFEGTNEINRLVISDTLLKKAMKGDVDMFDQDLTPIPFIGNNDYFTEKRINIWNFKKAVCLVFSNAYETLKKQFSSEQEVNMNISDMIMQLYAAESLMLRIEKLEINHTADPLLKDILNIFIYETAAVIQKSGMDALMGFSSEKTNSLVIALSELTKTLPFNIKDARRRIASKMIEENKYCF